ncbi:unnamed protein product [Caenorhabditis sp. 36 PRJEB53466]|nr:unnamed protein product [Caenorhabditis sp. 36 PRJEB53466]
MKEKEGESDKETKTEEDKKKTNVEMPPIPPTVLTMKVSFTFKISDKDVGKAANEVIQLEDDMTVLFVSKNSFFNGFILGDKLIKVNDTTEKEKCVLELLKGESTVEVMRRKGAIPVTKERMTKNKYQVRDGCACFLLEVERLPNMTTTSVGIRCVNRQNRAIVVMVEPNGIVSPFVGIGDKIVEFDGVRLPKKGGMDAENAFVREQLSKLGAGKRVELLVERPISESQRAILYHYISTVTSSNDVKKMAKDAVDIGKEASRMHFLVLKKINPTSILSLDVRKTKKTNKKTNDASSSSISISTSSAEMKIRSDALEPLKPVVQKSHALINEPEDWDDGQEDEFDANND